SLLDNSSVNSYNARSFIPRLTSTQGVPMRRFLSGIGVCLLLATIILSAQNEQSVPTLDNEISGTWFVELASPPTVEGTALATLEGEEEGFHAAAASAGVVYSEGRHFRKLWNGLTVRASAGDI